MQNMKDFLLKALSKITKNEFHPGGYWGTEMRFLLGFYEPESVALCKKFIKPGMNVLDIGSDIGYYAKIFSKLVGQEGKVYAFEPHPFIFGKMLKNLRSLIFKNVYPVQAAVSDKMGKTFLYETKKHGRHSLFDVSKYDEKFEAIGKIPIHTVVLDDFLEKEGSPRIDFFKIDVEGGEIGALKGMEKTIKRSNRLAGIIEFNANALSAAGEDPSQFINILHNFGFEVKEIALTGALKDIDQETHNVAKKLSVNLFCFKGRGSKY